MQKMVLATLLRNLKLSSLSSILVTLSTSKLTIFKLIYYVIVTDTFPFSLFSQGYPVHFEFLCLPRLCLDVFLVHIVELWFNCSSFIFIFFDPISGKLCV